MTPSANPARVLIVDDIPRLRTSLRILVDSDPGLRTVGEAGNGEDAIALAASLHPDVVMMDVQMPGLDGLAATERILQTAPAPRVLVLTTFDLDEYVYDALKAGASGFLLKNAPPEEILRGIHVVHAGNAMLAPEVTARLITEISGRRPARRSPLGSSGMLSERELDVVRLIADGYSNGEIAARLFLSPETVKTYVSRLLLKLRVRDRTQLAILAHEAGLLREQR